MFQKETLMDSSILQMLMSKYDTATITKQQLAKEMCVSLSTIDKLIAKGNVLPKPIKIGTGVNASIRFSITDIAEYITNNQGEQL